MTPEQTAEKFIQHWENIARLCDQAHEPLLTLDYIEGGSGRAALQMEITELRALIESSYADEAQREQLLTDLRYVEILELYRLPTMGRVQ